MEVKEWQFSKNWLELYLSSKRLCNDLGFLTKTSQWCNHSKYVFIVPLLLTLIPNLIGVKDYLPLYFHMPILKLPENLAKFLLPCGMRIEIVDFLMNVSYKNKIETCLMSMLLKWVEMKNPRHLKAWSVRESQCCNCSFKHIFGRCNALVTSWLLPSSFFFWKISFSLR